MNDILLFTLLTLCLLSVVFAVLLYFVAQKFKVIEDPKIDLVEEVLPKANCGGCGFPGCRNFAEGLVKSANEQNSIGSLNCPVGGIEVMKQVSAILGLETQEHEPLIAVVRCNGSFAHSPARIKYDGVSSCAFAHQLFAGEGGCQYGCLGLGDCVESCLFDAIHMDEARGLPVVNDLCVACGACVKACPRGIIELRFKGKKDRRIFVSCINKEKGGQAKKNCSVACIGCFKCQQVCPHDAIIMANNLAYIDFEKCKLCRKCVEVCPTDAIHEINFPPPKPKAETAELRPRPKTPDDKEVLTETENTQKITAVEE